MEAIISITIVITVTALAVIFKKVNGANNSIHNH